MSITTSANSSSPIPMAPTPSPASTMYVPLPTRLLRPNAFLCTFTVLIIAAIVRRVDAQGRTFDRCETRDDCQTRFCLGKIKNTEKTITCQPTVSKECFCLSYSFNYCELHAECPKGEVCAANPKSGNKICVGCAVVKETARNFTAAEKVPTKRCPTKKKPTPTPAPIDLAGKGYEACSSSLPCASGFNCTAISLTTPSTCSSTDLICSCYSAELRNCTAPSDCESGETCSFDSFFNTTECTGCTFANSEIYQHPLSPDTCKGKPKRPKPSYLPTRNGLSQDSCESDLTCKNPLRCRRRNFMLCEESPEPCFCLPPKSIQSCEKSQECQYGELCIRDSSGGKSACKSRFSLIILEDIGYKSVGKENPAPPLPNTTGHPEDSCRYDWDCQGKLRCTHEEDTFGGCAGRRACTCRSIERRRCQDDQDCDPGAVCAKIVDGTSHPFCLSPKVLRRDSNYVADAVNRSTSPLPVWGVGLTGDLCRNDTDCAPVLNGKSRACRHVSEEITPCNGRNSCYCRLPVNQNCASSSDCEAREICTNFKDALEAQPECRSQAAVSRDVYDLYDELVAVSPSVEPIMASPDEVTPTPGQKTTEPEEVVSPEPTRGGMAPSLEPTLEATASDQSSCIAANALAHLPGHALVFADAVHAIVLCDLDANCATPGHIVVHRGRAMMMHTYCQGSTTCVRRTMLVNSPRMRRGLRIASRTRDFEYTALAARFETSIEELVLTRLVHLGV